MLKKTIMDKIVPFVALLASVCVIVEFAVKYKARIRNKLKTIRNPVETSAMVAKGFSAICLLMAVVTRFVVDNRFAPVTWASLCLIFSALSFLCSRNPPDRKSIVLDLVNPFFLLVLLVLDSLAR